jgi:antitoxin component of RelBE/YafQ-DinJ toxin-antitoxin module
MKVSKDGKSETITIKVSAKTKARAMALYEKMDTNMAFNSFLGEMVKKGIAFEEIWQRKEEEVLEELAGKKVDMPLYDERIQVGVK